MLDFFDEVASFFTAIWDVITRTVSFTTLIGRLIQQVVVSLVEIFGYLPIILSSAFIVVLLVYVVKFILAR